MKSIRSILSAFVVSAVVVALAGCGSSTSVTSPNGALNNAPPAAPTNVHGTYNATNGENYINWDASSSASVASYEVWQYAADPATGASGSLVGNANASAVSLDVGTVSQNTTAYFRVRAVDGSGNPSAFSATTSFLLQATTNGFGSGGGGSSKNPKTLL